MLAAVIEAVGGGGAMTVIRMPVAGEQASVGGKLFVPAVTVNWPLDSNGFVELKIVSRLSL